MSLDNGKAVITVLNLIAHRSQLEADCIENHIANLSM